jgi:diguanylate cyclase (GGDEF)-like protein
VGRSTARFAWASAALLLVFLGWLCLPGRSPESRQLVSSLSFVLAPAVGSWRCWGAARRRDPWRRTWLLLTAALGVWATGSAYWDVLDLRSPGTPAFPSPADAAWLAFPLLAVAALLALPAMPRRATPAARLLLDGVASAAALLLLAWLGPLSAVGRDVPGLAHAVLTAYPSLDVLAVAVVVVVLDRLRSGLRDPATLVALAVAGSCTTDLTYALLSAHGAYTPGGPLDVMWAASFLLLGVAAGLRPATHEPVAAQHRPLPTVPAALALIGLIASGRLSSGLHPLTLVDVTVLGVALAARQHLLAAENRGLHHSLERRVAERTAELQEAREIYRRRAYTDPLTGLANRDAFNEALAVAAEQEGGFVAVVLLDLDGFKRVNDSFGHESGDELLLAVAERLRGSVRGGSETTLDVARLGGDEFACLLRGLLAPADADTVAERLLTALHESFVVGGHEFFLAASAGVAVAACPVSHAPGELLREADTAMYVAKEAGGNGFRTFDSRMHSVVVERLALEADLHRAIAEGEIRVHYQPVTSLSEDRITGVEALARWTHPTRGPVSPLDFIPVAERTGLIVQLERQVLERALTEVARWRALVPDLRVGVNFSARHLREPETVAHVLDCLKRHGLPPDCLVAEVTESLFFTAEDVVSAVVQELHEAGVVLALDDFGTGYSSLSRLSQHPFRILKIDRSFLAEVTQTSAPPAILLATLAMARGLGLDVVAEGVETETQLQFLVDHGCGFAQGYLLGRPVVPESIELVQLPVQRAAV